MGLFDRLKSGLSRTREGLVGRITSLVTGAGRIDDDLYDSLEETLIQADVGVETAIDLVEYLRSESRQRLEAAVRRLPEDQHMVIVLRFIEEMDYAQVAEIMGKSQGALRVIQHRALAALRKILEQEGGESVEERGSGSGRLSGETGGR